jgi:hypothetical protein
VSDRHIWILAGAAERASRRVAEHSRRRGEGTVQAADRRTDLERTAARTNARLTAAKDRRRRDP